MAYILSKGRSAIHANVSVVNIWRSQTQNGEEMEIKSRRREEKVELDTALRYCIYPFLLALASGRRDKAGESDLN